MVETDCRATLAGLEAGFSGKPSTPQMTPASIREAYERGYDKGRDIRIASEAHTLRVAEAVREACAWVCDYAAQKAAELPKMGGAADMAVVEVLQISEEAIRALDIWRIVEEVGRD